MKAKLRFNLPEDDFDYLLANSIGGMYTILHDLRQKLKYKLKHNDVMLSHPKKNTPSIL
jgi:hypothetical protein